MINVDGSIGISIPVRSLEGISLGDIQVDSIEIIGTDTNTKYGYEVLENITTGTSNSGFGYNALKAVTEGVSNCAIGRNALPAITSGDKNVGMGRDAGKALTEGDENTCVGQGALQACLTASYNTAIGSLALYNCTAGLNVAIGFASMLSNVSGESNACVGRSSGRTLESGSNNVFIGDQAGHTGQTVDVDNSIGIGSGVVTTSSNQVIIGNDSIVDTKLKGVVTLNDHIRSNTSIYRRYYHLPQGSFNPGASGATRVNPDANGVGGWQLDAAVEVLHMDVDVHSDWDGSSNLDLEVYFQKNTSGGSAGDTVDLKAVIYYIGVGEVATKTQTVEIATVVNDDAQYTQYKVEFEIDWDFASNVVEAGDLVSIALNLETDTSECDDIIINHASFYYKTTHIGVEDGDV